MSVLVIGTRRFAILNHLRIMHCLVGMGDKHSARLHYQQYAENLQREMGITPDEPLRNYAEELE